MQRPVPKKRRKNETAASRRFKRRSNRRGPPKAIEMSQLSQFVAERSPFILKNRFLIGERKGPLFVVRQMRPPGHVWMFWDTKFIGGMWIVARLAGDARSISHRNISTYNKARRNLPKEKIHEVNGYIAARAVECGGYHEHQQQHGSTHDDARINRDVSDYHHARNNKAKYGPYRQDTEVTRNKRAEDQETTNKYGPILRTLPN